MVLLYIVEIISYLLLVPSGHLVMSISYIDDVYLSFLCYKSVS